MTDKIRKLSLKDPDTVGEQLADEIINASKGSSGNSFSVKKKDEIERVAKGNR